MTSATAAASALAQLKGVPLFQELLNSGGDCPAFFMAGQVLEVEPGERVVDHGSPAAFYVVLEGDLQVFKHSAEGELLLTTHHPGAFFGEIPLLMGGGFIAAGQATGHARVWKLEEEPFWQMLATCPSVTRQIMQTMATRVRDLESYAQGREKLVSLGTMAAGLAHELNNPAAGTRHAARELKEAVGALPRYGCQMHKQQLSPEQLDYLADVGRQLQDRAGCNFKLSPLQRADLEDELADWMEERGVTDSAHLAALFVAAKLDARWLEEVEAQVGTKALDPVLSWLGVSLVVDGSVKAIDEGTQRISDLVTAIKQYSHLDQSPVGNVDVAAGITSTLTILGHKLKYIEVEKDFQESLPLIWGFAGELNQVWTNLLDNAADAVAGQDVRRVAVRTGEEGAHIWVEVEDNGPGMSKEVLKRLFEPFFTTKGVGRGTGLGLATCYRVVQGRHHGTISVTSEPGRTVFRVLLPVSPPAGSQEFQMDCVPAAQ